MGERMTYTADDLDAALLDEETSWEGSYFELEDTLDSTHEWVTVPEGTPGARTWDGGETYELRQEKSEKGIYLPGFGRITLAEQHGGMDQGSDLWMVIAVTGDDGTVRHFRKSGWYASYDGGSYDEDLEEVQAKEKTITVWAAL